MDEDVAGDPPIKTLLIEVTRLHHHVAAASRRAMSPGDLTNAEVSVLRSLSTAGARTVPELATERAIARQPVQRVVSTLAAGGLVRLEDNPRHRRSRLVALTARGRRRLREMERRQARWGRPLGRGLSERNIRLAIRLLRQIRERLTEPVPDRGTPT